MLFRIHAQLALQVRNRQCGFTFFDPRSQTGIVSIGRGFWAVAGFGFGRQKGQFCCWPYGRVALGKEAAGIAEAKRVVEGVAVAVVALAVVGHLHKGIGADETANQGVIHAAIHVDELKFIKMFMHGEATSRAKGNGHISISPGLCIAAAAPGIETEIFRAAFLVYQRCKASLMVFEYIFHAAIVSVFDRKNSKNSCWRAEVVDKFLRIVFVNHFIKWSEIAGLLAVILGKACFILQNAFMVRAIGYIERIVTFCYAFYVLYYHTIDLCGGGDEKDKGIIFSMIDIMLTKKKFKDFFQKNVSAL